MLKKVWKINQDEQGKYEKIVWKNVLRYKNHHNIFKQEGNPAHNSKRTQVWLMNNLTEVWEKEIRPPSSPDCIPFDYFAGGVSELRVRANPPKKPETWSLTSGRLWGFSPGTPWRRPARSSGACSMLSLKLTAISLNKLILSTFLCRPIFTLIKSDGF